MANNETTPDPLDDIELSHRAENAVTRLNKQAIRFIRVAFLDQVDVWQKETAARFGKVMAERLAGELRKLLENAPASVLLDVTDETKRKRKPPKRRLTPAFKKELKKLVKTTKQLTDQLAEDFPSARARKLADDFKKLK
jgi:hypothetical protein